MRKFLNFAVVAILAIAASACSGLNYGPNQGIGTVVGAGLGGLAGNQFGGGKGNTIATVLGVLGGGWVGSEIGRNMDAQQQRVYVHPGYPPVYYGGGGLAQCEALGEVSQARADCVRSLSEQRIRQQGREIEMERRQRLWLYGY